MFKMIYIFFICLFTIQTTPIIPSDFTHISDINPTIIIQPRYASPQNFMAKTAQGYLQKTSILSIQAALALSLVQQDMKKLGFSLVVYDGYRPQKAVNDFIRWANQPQDNKTKQQFYPYVDKADIFTKGYLVQKSGHVRGSTVDLSYIQLGKEVHDVELVKVDLTDGSKVLYRDDGTQFMCTHFDYFGDASHHDTWLVSQQCLRKRNLLRQVMLRNGYKEYEYQWWHFTLYDEPYPDTYFDFDIQ